MVFYRRQLRKEKWEAPPAGRQGITHFLAIDKAKKLP